MAEDPEAGRTQTNPVGLDDFIAKEQNITQKYRGCSYSKNNKYTEKQRVGDPGEVVAKVNTETKHPIQTVTESANLYITVQHQSSI